MFESRTCTAIALGSGASSFLLVSLRDALLAGSLCSAREARGDSEQAKSWYELEFSWASSRHGEALRIGVDDTGKVIAAETWLLPTCEDSKKFGRLPDLLWALQSARRVDALHAIDRDGDGEVFEFALEFDTGRRHAIKQLVDSKPRPDVV